MTRSLFRLGLVVAAVALGLTPAVAVADDQPFKSRVTPYAATQYEEDGYYVALVDFAGNTTHMGQSAARAIDYTPIDNIWIGWGSMTITGAAGDSVKLEYEVEFDFVEQVWVGSFTITGGTGRFEDAIGGGDLMIVFPGDGPPTWNFDGTIDY